MKTLLAACVILAVATTVQCVKWKDCGSKQGKITKLTVKGCEKLDECPLKRGTNVSLEVDFSTKEAVSKATSVVHGIIDGIPIPFPLGNPNACVDSGLTCPLASGGTFAYKTDIFVKSIYPKVRVVIKWELKDESSNDVFCFEMPASIVD